MTKRRRLGVRGCAPSRPARSTWPARCRVPQSSTAGAGVRAVKTNASRGRLALFTGGLLGAAGGSAAERREDGGAQRRLDLFLGHFGAHRQDWRCVACEGLGFDSFGRCEECCGWGWFLWPDWAVQEAFS